jgi:hypothetical protein
MFLKNGSTTKRQVRQDTDNLSLKVSVDGALKSVKVFFFLDFVHRLYFNKITPFRKLDLLPSSGKKGKDRNFCCWAPWLS